MMCCFTFSVTAMQAPCLMERTEHSRRFIPSLVQSRPRRYHPYGVLGQYMDGYPTSQDLEEGNRRWAQRLPIQRHRKTPTMAKITIIKIDDAGR
jgi:hypothetical protein